MPQYPSVTYKAKIMAVFVLVHFLAYKMLSGDALINSLKRMQSVSVKGELIGLSGVLWLGLDGLLEEREKNWPRCQR